MKPSSLVDRVVGIELLRSLRSLGFKKQGRTFRRERQAAVQVINVQSSAWNFADRASFTVNLGLYFPAVAQALGEEPDRVPLEHSCHLRARIGDLLGGADIWWEVRSDDDPSDASSALSSAMLGPGLKWLEAAATHEGAAQVCVSLARYDWAAVLAHGAGDLSMAAVYLFRALSTPSAQRDTLKAWSRERGIVPKAAV